MGIGKGIIFIDLNGTLLDKVDKLSVPIEILQSAIKSVQSAGWVVGLCSDSPLEPLVEYQEKIRAIGPTLAENGTLFFDNRIITKLKEINR